MSIRHRRMLAAIASRLVAVLLALAVFACTRDDHTVTPVNTGVHTTVHTVTTGVDTDAGDVHTRAPGVTQ